MTGFELRTSGIGSNRSTNWATTTAPRNSIRLSSIELEGRAPDQYLIHLDVDWKVPMDPVRVKVDSLCTFIDGPPFSKDWLDQDLIPTRVFTQSPYLSRVSYLDYYRI